MIYTIENEKLCVRVNGTGAELTGVENKETGEEMLWSADAELWGRHAPILFPYCGRLRGGAYTVDGVRYEGGQHGFARDMEFAPAEGEAGTLTLVLQANALTMEKYPFAFKLTVSYTLEGSTVHQSVRVDNEDDKPLRFGFGFHPGFMCPFDAQHTVEDYTFTFDTPQTPTVEEVDISNGLITGAKHTYFYGESEIPITDHLFDNDSIAFSGLTAQTLSVTEKDTGRSVTVDIAAFPYVLIWATPHKSVRFVCIEPWHTLPDAATAGGNWEDKPAAAQLAPGEHWETSLNMTFNR